MKAAEHHGNGTEGRHSAAVRDAIRTAVAGAKYKSRTISFFGQEVEVRQPSLASIIGSGSPVGEDGSVEDRSTMVHGMIANCYVPGTNDQVFDDSDRDMLMNLPFGKDVKLMIQTLTELMDVNPTEKSEDSTGISGSSQ